MLILVNVSPNKAAEMKSENAWDIPEDAFVIGKTARFHRQKNHMDFLHSAALLQNTPSCAFRDGRHQC